MIQSFLALLTTHLPSFFELSLPLQSGDSKASTRLGGRQGTPSFPGTNFKLVPCVLKLPLGILQLNLIRSLKPEWHPWTLVIFSGKTTSHPHVLSPCCLLCQCWFFSLPRGKSILPCSTAVLSVQTRKENNVLKSLGSQSLLCYKVCLQLVSINLSSLPSVFPSPPLLCLFHILVPAFKLQTL